MLVAPLGGEHRSSAHTMTAPPRSTVAAALLGTAAGLRTFTPMALLAARGRLGTDPRLLRAVGLAAAGELIGDKLPFVPSRTKPLPLLGRMASGALCGSRVAGSAGALVGAGAGFTAALVGYRARRMATGGMPALRAALREDTVAIAAAALGVALSRDTAPPAG
ncbi:MAG TPA: hypothetical protein VFN36_03085 [Solirubrobacteraceae bacterium]|nr:hypothetical protein [Solirubrobacteraceae bacterium]